MIANDSCVGRFPGGQTLYVEPSSVDNLMIAVCGRFPGGQTLYVEPSSVDNLMIAVCVGFLEDKRCMLNRLL